MAGAPVDTLEPEGHLLIKLEYVCVQKIVHLHKRIIDVLTGNASCLDRESDEPYYDSVCIGETCVPFP